MTYMVRTIFENDDVEVDITEQGDVFVTNKKSRLQDTCVRVSPTVNGDLIVAAATPLCEFIHRVINRKNKILELIATNVNR